MSHAYFPDIDQLPPLPQKKIEDTFEYLCKDLLEWCKKFEFPNHFVIEKWFPWIESRVIQDNNGKFHGFQCKYSDDPITQLNHSFFWKNYSTKALKKDKNPKCKIKAEHLDYLHVFVKWNVWDDSRKVIESTLRKFYPDIIVDRRNWARINEELRHQNSVSIRYFPEADNLRYIHSQDKLYAKERSKEDVQKDIDTNEIEEQKNYWMIWKYRKIDAKIAKESYEDYILSKYSYFDTSSFDSFRELEKMVEDDEFDNLEFETLYHKKDFKALLDYFRQDIDSLSKDNLNKITIDDFLDRTMAKQWLLINSWVHDKCNFEFIEEDNVRFKSKVKKDDKKWK